MIVISAPDIRLRIQTKPVIKINNALLNTLKEMVKVTKSFKDPEGVGLASTQIGLSERFFIAKDDKKFMMVVNPKVESFSKKTKSYFEGCLSIPGTWGEVKRYIGIKVSYQDEKGEIITKNLRGMLAWIFQHEIDHLNGVLFSDKVLQQKGRFYKYTGKDRAGSDTYEEVTI